MNHPRLSYGKVSEVGTFGDRESHLKVFQIDNGTRLTCDYASVKLGLVCTSLAVDFLVQWTTMCSTFVRTAANAVHEESGNNAGGSRILLHSTCLSAVIGAGVGGAVSKCRRLVPF